MILKSEKWWKIVANFPHQLLNLPIYFQSNPCPREIKYHPYKNSKNVIRCFHSSLRSTLFPTHSGKKFIHWRNRKLAASSKQKCRWKPSKANRPLIHHAPPPHEFRLWRFFSSSPSNLPLNPPCYVLCNLYES